jgi:hypothetical protein
MYRTILVNEDLAQSLLNVVASKTISASKVILRARGYRRWL